MNRIENLRKSTLLTEHAVSRIDMPSTWDTKDLSLSLPERKAMAIRKILEEMPLYIGEEELIVGTRTVYKRTQDEDEKSGFDYNAMPSYVNEDDIRYFGFNHEFVSKAHYAPGYELIMKRGISRLLKEIDENLESVYKLQDQIDFGKSVKIAYEGLQTLILRYSEYAKQCSEKTGGRRKNELKKISEICENIAYHVPRNLQEAAQLYWFLYLGAIIENFQFINYGRIDQILGAYLTCESEEEIREIMGCLLLKMYDQYDLILVDKNLMGKYSAQHNITIGGVTREGENACNPVTKGILEALKETRLPEPLISVRITENDPQWYLELASELTVSGLNCMAYYHDEQVIESLAYAGIPVEDARNYGFGLCQDILIPGYADHYCSGGVNLTLELLDHIKAHKDKDSTYPEFFQSYVERVLNTIDHNLTGYNLWEQAIKDWNEGNRDTFFEYVKDGKINPSEPSLGINAAQAARNESDEENGELYIQTLMSPLPITSAMYLGCLEEGIDITRCGCVRKDKGVMLTGPVVAFNSLAALKKVVFEEKRYTLREIDEALSKNFEGHEEMRQWLWNAPKWCNDDDYVDADAVKLVVEASKKINEYETPYGGKHLAGVHQPHPVFAGRTLPATPEGRFAGTPIPVTISPENGTLKCGPSAAMKSAAKIPGKYLQWNSCLMLQYYSSTFGTKDGAEKFMMMLRAYYKLGGIQHQPNVVDIDKLKDAQIHPEEYKDLIIRMWGVSAHFVDLPKDVQDEFIARYDF